MGKAHGHGPWARPMGPAHGPEIREKNGIQTKQNDKNHGVLWTARMDPSRRGVMDAYR